MRDSGVAVGAVLTATRAEFPEFVPGCVGQWQAAVQMCDGGAVPAVPRPQTARLECREAFPGMTLGNSGVTVPLPLPEDARVNRPAHVLLTTVLLSCLFACADDGGEEGGEGSSELTIVPTPSAQCDGPEWSFSATTRGADSLSLELTHSDGRSESHPMVQGDESGGNTAWSLRVTAGTFDAGTSTEFECSDFVSVATKYRAADEAGDEICFIRLDPEPC